jgi:Icc-related predicted phosphoesterase
LNELGDEAARHFAAVVPEALERYARVVVAVHVPPFGEAARHRGSSSDDDWLPYCACRAVGEVLHEAAVRRPDRQLLVLCGHTHENCEIAVRPNLRVLTGGWDNGRAALQRVFQW